MRTFTRVANMSPGLRDTGDEIDAAHINELQQAAEDLQAGALPIALAGIEGALGAYEPLQNIRSSVVNVRDFGAMGLGADYTAEIQAAYDSLPDAVGPTWGGGVVEIPPGRYGVTQIVLNLHKPAVFMRVGGASARRPSALQPSGGDAVLIGLDSSVDSSMFTANYESGWNGYGFQWKSLQFDMSAGTYYGIDLRNVSFVLVDDCGAYSVDSMGYAQWFLRAAADVGTASDSSWWRVTDNLTSRVGLATVGNAGSYAFNNWGFTGNVVFPGAYCDSCIHMINAKRCFSLGNNLEPGANPAYGWYLDNVLHSIFLGDSGESTYDGNVFIKAVRCNANLFAPLGNSVVLGANDKLIEDDGTNILLASPATGYGGLYSHAEVTRAVLSSQNTGTAMFPHGMSSLNLANVPTPLVINRWNGSQTLYDIGHIAAEYWDGSAWVSWAPTGLANLEVDNSSVISVDDTHKKLRIKFDRTGVPDWPLIVAKFRRGTGSPSGTVGVTVESMDSAGTAVAATYSFDLPLDYNLDGFSFPTGFVAGPYLQVTIEFPLTSGQTMNFSRIACYTAAIGRPNGKNLGGRLFRGSGTPEGVIQGNIGDMYTRVDGGAGTTLYVKESGSSTTGWIAK